MKVGQSMAVVIGDVSAFNPDHWSKLGLKFLPQDYEINLSLKTLRTHEKCKVYLFKRYI